MEPEIAAALHRASTYPHRIDAEIISINSYTSTVYLTGNFAYKFKKSINLGYIDFSTLERRKTLCEKECTLNQRICPDLYIAAVPLYQAGSVLRLEQELLGGRIVDYAVKMKQFQPEATLDRLVRTSRWQELRLEQFRQLGTSIGSFHRTATVCQDNFVERLQEIILRNYDELTCLLADTPANTEFHEMKHAQQALLETILPSLHQRMAARWVRDCHGDLHLGNLALINRKIIAFDCLEFNDQLRHIDVMYDLAYLCTDLIRHDLLEYCRQLLGAYKKELGAGFAPELLPFLCSIRGMIKGKLELLRSAQEKDVELRSQAHERARTLFALAQRLAQQRQGLSFDE